MLAPRDVFNILRAQREAPNVLFGDLAVEMGLLTRDDVMQLLMIQADRKRPIGDILVRQGVLTESQLKAEMAAYRRAMLESKRPPAALKLVPIPNAREVANAPKETLTAL